MYYNIVQGSLFRDGVFDEVNAAKGKIIIYYANDYYIDHDYYYHVDVNGNTTYRIGPFTYNSSYIPTQLVKDINNMIESCIINEELCERFYNYVDKIIDKYQYIMRTEFDYVEYEHDETIIDSWFLDHIYSELANFKLSPLLEDMLQNDDESINLAYTSLKNQISEILNNGVMMKSARKLI